MRTSTQSGTLIRASALFILGVGLLAATTSSAAAPLEEFTGYTRIGFPPSEGKVDFKFAEAAKHMKAVGVTVYFMVLDQKANNRGVRRVTGDTFGTGVNNFDVSFVPGQNADRSRLDTDARYLYLYQVINDSGRESVVKSASVRLLVDPSKITSWGHFAERKTTEKGTKSVIGLGFSSTFTNPKAKVENTTMIRPISTDFPAVTDRRYRTPAPAVTAARPYGFSTIALGDRPAAAGEDAGREPFQVQLLENVDFMGVEAVNISGAPLRDTEFLPGIDDAKSRDRLRNRSRNYWPALRAIWTDENPIKPRERSTLFGFTSNLPPTMDAVLLGTRGLEFRPAVGDGKGGIAPAVGKDDGKGGPIKPAEGPGGVGGTPGFTGAVPAISGTIPTPYEKVTARIRPVGGETSTGGETTAGGPGAGGAGGLGGLGTLGGTLGGASPGGVGGVSALSPPGSSFAPRGLSGGGGFGGSTGGGNDQGSGQNQPQDQTQGAGQKQSVINNITVRVDNKNTNNNNNNNNNNNKNGCCDTPNGNVVPAPPAWLLGLLGLPAFALLGRRKKVTPEIEATPTEDSSAPIE